MRINNIILPAVAATMLLTGCDDQIMEWGKPDGHADVTTADIPLAVKEVIANYSNIKDYAKQYTPNMLIGIGMGASLYTENTNGEGTLANANYMLFTPGNAMKHDALMGNSGTLKLSSLDNLIEGLNGNMQLYGHNFVWHTQQNQTYLKSIIAPQFVVESNSDIKTMLKNGDFETGTKDSWNSWGNSSTTEVCAEAANKGSYGIKLVNPTDAGSGNDYKAQLAQDIDAELTVGKTYTVRFKAKSESAAGTLQFCAQNSKTNAGEGYHSYAVGKDWTTCEHEYTVTKEGMNRFLINFGAVATTYYIDDVEFGIKEENLCTNGDFSDGTDGWTLTNKGAGIEVVSITDGPSGSNALKMVASSSSSNDWDLQVQSPSMATLPGEKVQISFYVKSDQAGAGRLSFSGLTNNYPYMNWTGKQDNWTKCFTTSTDWTEVNVVLQKYSTDFIEGESKWSFNFDFGTVPDVTYYINGVKVKKYTEEATTRAASLTAAKSYYVLKSAEEKQQILEGTMESFIKDVSAYLKEKGVTPYGYDVVNEPIADGTNKPRGYDNVFGGSVTDDDGNTVYDVAPEEDTENGLTLNWGNNHWYWGYYVPDYQVKAFQWARQYLPAETKLFVNDYNLETSPGKLAALIDFVKDIDQKNGTPIVDGIGTQMHVSLSCSDDTAKNNKSLLELKAQVDAMFKTMAATGKLVRVTELDITLNTKDPSSAQYEAQSNAYRIIVESYKANVPEAQQSGITIWSLSDNAAEHEYWLKDQKPNLFDTEYKRKWAYKGFCDGLAGEDLGLKFTGNDYKAYYEKNNVSSVFK